MQPTSNRRCTYAWPFPFRAQLQEPLHKPREDPHWHSLNMPSSSSGLDRRHAHYHHASSFPDMDPLELPVPFDR